MACVRLSWLVAGIVALMAIAVPFGEMPLGQGGVTAEPGRPPSLPPAKYKLVLDDNFRTLSLWDGKSGIWEPGFWHGGRYDATSGELEYYVDPRRGRDSLLIQRQSPFQLTEQGLQIVARPLPDKLHALIAGQSYTSGFISTRRSVPLTYGYVEIRARIPEGSGLWPAFWMLPEDESWPPEIDILEAIGGEGPQYWATVHFGAQEPEGRSMYKVLAPTLRETFHDFGLLWTPERLVWTFDGHEVAQNTTPDNLKNKKMYLIICMAIGGGWAKAPKDPAVFPAKLEIERVRMYSRPDIK